MFPLRDENPRTTFPLVTLLLIAANTAVFSYELLLGHAAEPWIKDWAIVPDAWRAIFDGAANGPQIQNAVTRIFSSLFIHGGVSHWLGNMWFLWIFGDNIEGAFGKLQYLAYYFAWGVIAAFVHIAFNIDSSIPTIGASGAISGVLGAYLVLYPHVRVRTLVVLGFLIEIIRVPALWFLGLWFVLQAIGGAGAENSSVAFAAHVGGFIAGVATAWLLRPRRSRDVRWTES